MRRFGWMVIGVAMLTVGLFGQEGQPAAEKGAAAKPVAAYRLDFVIRELQSTKVINSRQYMMIVEDGKRGDLKIGTRLPVPSGPRETKAFTYYDVGLNLWSVVQSNGSSIALNTTLDLSTLPGTDEEASKWQEVGAPPIRQVRTSFPALVREGQQTTIGGMDDITTNRRYEISVTATKVK